MKISWNETLNKICSDFLDSLRSDIEASQCLSDDIRRLIHVFMNYIDASADKDRDFESALREYVRSKGIKHVSELFEGELRVLPLFLLGREWIELWTAYMVSEARSPYTEGYSRRSVRSQRAELHIRNISKALKEFLILRATGFSALDILHDGRTESEIKELGTALQKTEWLTAMIMTGDKVCIDYLTDAMTSENNANRMTFEYFRAIVKSGDRDLLDLEGRLLLAARLQEGLRQSIVETMDEGLPESYITLLRVIHANGLQRYASVKRGLAVTTGLGETEAPERITDKYIDIALRYVENQEEARKAIDGNDAMALYLALWALAFYDIDAIVSPILNLIHSAPSYKVDAAMLILSILEDEDLCSRLASEAIRVRHADHDVMACAIAHYLNSPYLYLSSYGDLRSLPPLSRFFDSREEAEKDFDILASLLRSMKGTERFDHYVFPWMYAELTKGAIAGKLAKLAVLLDSPERIDEALDFIGYLDPYERAGAIRYLLKNPSSERQISAAIGFMADRGERPREAACQVVERLHSEGRLSAVHYDAMVDLLRLKAPEVRIFIISVISSLPDEKAAPLLSALLADKKTEKRLAALDIVKRWIEKGERTSLVKSLITDIKAIKRPSSKETILIGGILDSSARVTAKYTLANGFGLYNPADGMHLRAKHPEGFDIEKALSFPDPHRAEEIMLKIMSLIEENADYEFTDFSGETVRLGNTPMVNRYRHSLESLAKPEMWKDFYVREIGSPVDMLRLAIAIKRVDACDAPFFPLLRKLLGKAFHEEKPMPELRSRPYFTQAREVCRCLIKEYVGAPEVYRICADTLAVVVTSVDSGELLKRYRASDYYYDNIEDHSILDVWPFSMIRRMLEESALECDYDLFEDSFRARYSFYRMLGYRSRFNPVAPEEYLRLWEEGSIVDNEFWHEMLGREASCRMVDAMTHLLPGAFDRYSGKRDVCHLHPLERDLINTAVDRILEIELERGDTPTEVTPLARKVNVVKGIDYFLKILAGLADDKPKCNRMWDIGDGKRDIFSWLLRVSCPADGEDASALRSKSLAYGISDCRLVEAAMFSPRWLPLVEEAIGWPGLESAAYYFIAHAGENQSEWEKSHIARYTAVSPSDFSDGAFDPVWFGQVYRQLGKQRFEVVYEAAKYISDNNSHARARKLSDAALGILKVRDVKRQIEEKRNKDLVVAYGLIPLGRRRMTDLRQRYQTLQKFLKESRQFGSQRQASETRAVRLALENLARTAGFGDSARLTWSLESELIKEVAEYLCPKEIDGFSVYIEIDEGIPRIVAEREGRRLQSLPSRLKKDKNIERLRDVYRQLKDQHKRGRSLLESSMTDMSWFTGEEISHIRHNPVIWSMLSRLVLIREDNAIGFPADDAQGIVSPDGVTLALHSEDRVRIAHPYDLYMAGVWSRYQSELFNRRWRQPFKQVFRELYVPTVEEAGKSRSMRYAGNQIMPGRAVGVLKTRQWTVDYEQGLQKVCFVGNVTAVMYAMADWFSPSDIEAPTLEYVVFYDRLSMKEKKIGEIDPIVFSEVMRDVDLAVSIAHAGGVDPETSHSTIEMRREIVMHTIPMFGLDNVGVVGNFAKIRGSIGNYNIHLGSGVIHKEGGPQIAVLPVHSQGRGRIFLPFLDEDPKTAEIISKILLFAEDSKIKDPSILRQI